MTYYIVVNNPPEQLLDAWEALYETFGTEPFSRRAGLGVLIKKYPDFEESNLDRIIDGFARAGNLGIIPKEV